MVETPQLGHATACLLNQEAWKASSPCIHESPRRISGAIRTTSRTVGILGVRHPRRQSEGMAQGDAAAPGEKIDFASVVAVSHRCSAGSRQSVISVFSISALLNLFFRKTYQQVRDIFMKTIEPEKDLSGRGTNSCTNACGTGLHGRLSAS